MEIFKNYRFTDEKTRIKRVSPESINISKSAKAIPADFTKIFVVSAGDVFVPLESSAETDRIIENYCKNNKKEIEKFNDRTFLWNMEKDRPVSEQEFKPVYDVIREIGKNPIGLFISDGKQLFYVPRKIASPLQERFLLWLKMQKIPIFSDDEINIGFLLGIFYQDVWEDKKDEEVEKELSSMTISVEFESRVKTALIQKKKPGVIIHDEFLKNFLVEDKKDAPEKKNNHQNSSKKEELYLTDIIIDGLDVIKGITGEIKVDFPCKIKKAQCADGILFIVPDKSLEPEIAYPYFAELFSVSQDDERLIITYE